MKYTHRSIITFIVTCFLIGQTLAQVTLPTDPEKFHIFMLMGQSNMAGYGGVVVSDPYLPGDKDDVPGVYVLDGHGRPQSSAPLIPIAWRNGSHRLHVGLGSHQFGLGMDFAKEYMRLNPGISVGLIPCAWGGASISSLNKGSNIYQNALNRAGIAASSGSIKGVLWHQGESDTVTESLTSQYDVRIRQLLVDLRSDLANPFLTFVVGNLAEFYGTGGAHNAPDRVIRINKIRSILRNFAADDSLAGFVETTGLTSADGHLVHFDRASNITLGERYAVVMSPLVTGQPMTARQILKVTLLADGSRQLDWTESIGQIYDVQYSTHLIDWQNIATAATDGSFIDSDSTRLAAPRSFYRLLIRLPEVIQPEPVTLAESISQDEGNSASSSPPVALISQAIDLSYVSPSGAEDAWHTQTGTTTSTMTIMLDQNYDLTEFHLWNYNHGTHWQLGVGSFTLEVSSNVSGEDFVQIGEIFIPSGGANVSAAETFPFEASNVRRVRWRVLSNLGHPTILKVGASEISFSGTPSPTP